MQDLRSLGLIWAIYGCFQIVVALAFGVVFGAAGLLPMVSGEQDGPMIGAIFMVMAVVMVVVFAVLAIPTLVGAWGLRNGKKWGAIVIGVLSLFMLMSFPIGTIMGGWTLYTLSKGDVWASLT